MYNKDHDVYPVLQKIGREITGLKPKAVVVFSAHWQAKPDSIQVNNALMTDLIYEFVQPAGPQVVVRKRFRELTPAQLLWLSGLYVQGPVPQSG